MLTFKGIGIGNGIAVGKIYLLNELQEFYFKERKIEDKENEINKFKNALKKTHEQLVELEKKMISLEEKEYAELIKAWIEMVDDPLLLLEVSKMIEQESINAESALLKVIRSFEKNFFSKLENEYIKQRFEDLKSVSEYILKNLLPEEKDLKIQDNKEKVIIFAHNLLPHQILSVMDNKNVVGFVTEVGSSTSHLAIILKATRLPAVIGLGRIGKVLKKDTLCIIDAQNGKFIIEPPLEILKEYEVKIIKIEKEREELKKLREKPATTKDGRVIKLLANVEFLEELDYLKEVGAEGIGLYRTEFLYLQRQSLPSFEYQLETYKKIAQKVGNLPIVIRTIDLGGDKFLSSIQLPIEMNPLLGLRAIRFCMRYPNIFKEQLRAIIKVFESLALDIKLLFPFICDLSEIRFVKEMVEEVKKQEGVEKDVKIGIMIETPAAVLLAESFAKEVDFFSIGTNDLIQYTLAVDRANPEVAYLYKPIHPAILKLIKSVCDVAFKYNKGLCVCGEVASEEEYVSLLIGMGIQELSMAATYIPKIKKFIRKIYYGEAKKLVDEILLCDDTQQAQMILQQRIRQWAG